MKIQYALSVGAGQGRMEEEKGNIYPENCKGSRRRRRKRQGKEVKLSL